MLKSFFLVLHFFSARGSSSLAANTKSAFETKGIWLLFM